METNTQIMSAQSAYATKADLKLARSWFNNHRVTKDNRIIGGRHGRGQHLGTIEGTRSDWYAILDISITGRPLVIGKQGDTKKTAAHWVLYDLYHRVAVDFLVGLMVRHPERLDDIKYALNVTEKEDENGLKWLVCEHHYDEAYRIWEHDHKDK
jgi:hypothetical protein